ncbi:MAG TPA: aldo/keto reductase [Roseiflexaceae bacterium]|jgi:D-threo-aldose 1-dehydrogenase|nr:aldo/keto reductase [Roseiflexaceae bacterium]
MTLFKQSVQVGKTKLQVSSLGLGTVPIGKMYVPVSDEQAVATVRTALDQGITLFDTAPLYGAGLSERRLGMALAEVPRDRYVLATKVGRVVELDGSVHFDWTRDGILRSFDESMQRLKLERIDIVHIHDPDEHYREALDVVFPILADLRSQGVIKAIGAGMNQWQMEADFARNADFDCFLLAGRYTLLEQGALPLFDVCQQKRIGIFLGGVYNSGILATGAQPGAKYNYADAPPEILERARRIQAVCARHDVPLNVAALQFSLAHPAVTALVVGAGSPDEVKANRAALDQPLPSALWEELKREGLLRDEVPTP